MGEYAVKFWEGAKTALKWSLVLLVILIISIFIWISSMKDSKGFGQVITLFLGIYVVAAAVYFGLGIALIKGLHNAGGKWHAIGGGLAYFLLFGGVGSGIMVTTH